MPRVLLVSPHVPMEVVYGPAARGAGAVLPPLGILYLASYLKTQGRDGIEVLDANVLEWEPARVMERVQASKPEVVGISATTLGFPYAVDMARAVRAFDPTIVLVLGGPHAKGARDEVFRTDPGVFDYVCYGEGEIALATLLDFLDGKTSESGLKGFLYLRAGALVTSPEAATPLDLDLLGHPGEFMDPAWVPRYHEKVMAYKARPMFSVCASRGCPFHCTFCSAPNEFRSIHGHRLRLHSVRWILDEIRILKERFGVREVVFVDDTFNLQRKRVMEFCEALAREDLRLSWTCNFEAHIADPTMLSAMRRAGCWSIMIGAESGDPRVLMDLRKGVTVEELSALGAWCEEAGIASRPSFILGTPTDTRESIRRTIDFAARGRFHFPYFQLYVPLPGTEMFSVLAQHGRVLVKDRKEMAAAQVNYVPEGLDPEFLERAFREAHLRAYLNPRMFLRHLRLIRSGRDLARYLMAAWTVLRMAVSATDPGRPFGGKGA